MQPVGLLRAADLIAALSTEAGVPKRDARLVVKALVAAIQRAIAEGDAVTLQGLGTFQTKETASRFISRFGQGQEFLLPGFKVSFRPSRTLRALARS